MNKPKFILRRVDNRMDEINEAKFVILRLCAILAAGIWVCIGCMSSGLTLSASVSFGIAVVCFIFGVVD